MANFGLTDAGFLAPRAADILERMRSEYEDQTGLAINWASNIFLRTITAVAADRIGSLSEMLQALADSRDPDNATGYMLDIICALVNVYRRQATFSRVDLTLGGDSGTVVPQGSEVRDSLDQIWITTEAVVIDGTTVVEARAEVKGAVSATAGTITEITTPVSGWSTATNVSSATEGDERETDPELRARRLDSLQITGASAINAIRSAVAELDGVQAAVVIDNDEDTSETVAGITLDPHSYAVIVYPALTTTQQEALIREIYSRAPAGIKSIGTNSGTVTGNDGHEKIIRWRYAVEVPTDVTITVSGVDAGDVEDEIEAAVTAYFDGLSVGEGAYVLEIQGILAGIDGVKSGTVAFSAGAPDVEPTITEIVTLGTVGVS